MEKQRSSEETDADYGFLLNQKKKPSRKAQIALGWLHSGRRHYRIQSRRHPLRTTILTRYLPILLFVIFVLIPLFAPSYAHLPPHYRALENRCRDTGFEAGCANPRDEKIFISTIIYDGDGKLAGGAWGNRVVELINLLGPQNVFLSIYESDSGEEGKNALEDLKKRITCHHEIVFEDHVTLGGFPRVELPNGSRRIKRVAMLAELRNRALAPLNTFSPGKGMVWYDRVLFLNDIAFHAMDAVHLLLNTNQGPDGKSHYLAACAMDFYEPTKFYDVFALRDADGYALGLKTFPFFLSRGRGLSRADMDSRTDAVRVKSCWGGMMAMEAKYVQNRESKPPRHDFHTLGVHTIDPNRPHNVTAPVRFRYEPEPYYDACECCLFVADVAQAARDDRAIDAGVYVNPYVRVAYTEQVLNWLPTMKSWERWTGLLFRLQALLAPRTENPAREVQQGERFKEEIWTGREWEVVEREGRSGLFCGVREMQLLREQRRGGYNFVNTKIPPGQTLKFRSMWGEPLPKNWATAYMTVPEKQKDAYFEHDWLH